MELTKTARGAQTKALILETALELFKQRGYEQTTMRAIAEQAGVSLGNAYYYFKSKEHLIQAFYARLHDELLVEAAPILERRHDLKTRLHLVLRTAVEVMEPYHQFSAVLFKTAADPASPLNPFSPESVEARGQAIALFEEVVEGSKGRMPKDLRAEIGYMLWLYYMGIVLFWIHDNSAERSRTYRLVDRTCEIVVRLISLASHPLMRPLRKSALRLINDLKEDIK
ncbi:MAG TPA: TetR family transcriptional regulator [Blastocatellia bacterium]